MSSAPQPSDYHDALTELPNRRLFDDRLEQALHLARWGACEFALLVTEVADEAQCRVVAERLLTALDMDAGIGISRFPADGLDAAARPRARELGPRRYRLHAR